MDLHKWDGLLWSDVVGEGLRVFCPEHKMRLDIYDQWDTICGQDNAPNAPDDRTTFICPYDGKRWDKNQGLFTLRRRYDALRESKELKNAKIVDLDNIYTPVLKVEPKPKDDRYSIQVEIDTTPSGKKLVIYAADRSELPEKAQIFIDPQTDKISFDGTGDIHPNQVFSKVVAYFKDGKSATLEQENEGV